MIGLASLVLLLAGLAAASEDVLETDIDVAAKGKIHKVYRYEGDTSELEEASPLGPSLTIAGELTEAPDFDAIAQRWQIPQGPGTMEIAVGTRMPVFSFRVWSATPSPPSASPSQPKQPIAIEEMIAAGARGFSVRMGDGHELAAEVVQGINRAILKSSGTLHRGDFFLSVWVSCAETGVVEFMQAGGVPFIDLLILDRPCAASASGTSTARAMTLGRWHALEDMVAAGYVRALGVAHFDDIGDVRALVRSAATAMVGSPPVVNVAGFGVGRIDLEFVQANADLGVLAMATSAVNPALNLTQVNEIATARGMAPAQVALRFVMQLGLPSFVSTSNVDHVKSNLGALDLELTALELVQLARVDC
jgi:hypothetical protein